MFKPSWASYLMTGGMALIVSWALSGCIRVGNHVDDGPQPTQDPILGLYHTTAQSLTLNASTTTGSMASQQLSTNLIPSGVSQAMQDPVGIIPPDASHPYYAIVNPTSGMGFPTKITDNTAISSIENIAQGMLFNNDPGCIVTMWRKLKGSVSQYSSPIAMNGLLVRGGLSLDILIETSIDGASCATTMQNVQNCYLNVSQCQGATPTDQQNTQNILVSVFGPFIDAKYISTNDLPNLIYASYEVVYK